MQSHANTRPASRPSRSLPAEVSGPPLRIVHAGLGGWGRSWAEELLKRPELSETVAYVDVDPGMRELLRRAGHLTEAPWFSTLEEALAETDAEAVLITTPAVGHAPVALEAFAAGKHVLTEKPMAATLDEARAMVDAAAAADRTLMVSQNYRFFPAAQTAARLIRDEALGPVGSVRVDFRKYSNTPHPSRERHFALPHPLLMDMAIHQFDLMRYVLGREPVSIYCEARDPAWSLFSDPATANAIVDFEGGIPVSYRGSWVSTYPDTTWSGDWVVECERGSIEWTGREDFSTTAGDSVTIRTLDGAVERIELPEMERFDRMGAMEEFLRAVREGRAPLTHGADNIRSLALAVASVESASTGTVVRLD